MRNVRSLLVAAVAVTGFLWGERARAAQIDIDHVSVTTIPALPSTPSSIGAGERLSGFTLEPADPEMNRATSVLASEQGCMMRGDDPAAVIRTDADGDRVRPTLLNSLPMEGPKNPRIWSFRHEQLIRKGDDGGELLVVRGWFDRSTGGFRQIDRTTVPLTVLTYAPRVYGFRDGTLLQVVVPASEQSASTRDAEGLVRHVTCAHARVALPLDASAAEATIVSALPGEPVHHTRRSKRSHSPSLHVSVSVTRLSRDPHPWISLAVDQKD